MDLAGCVVARPSSRVSRVGEASFMWVDAVLGVSARFDKTPLSVDGIMVMNPQNERHAPELICEYFAKRIVSLRQLLLAIAVSMRARLLSANLFGQVVPARRSCLSPDLRHAHPLLSLSSGPRQSPRPFARCAHPFHVGHLDGKRRAIAVAGGFKTRGSCTVGSCFPENGDGASTPSLHQLSHRHRISTAR